MILRLHAAARRRAGRGFTLIELLVVLAILGILTTTVALTIANAPRHAAASDIQQLSLLLEAAMIEAQAGRRQLAWSGDAAGYEFWEDQTPRDRERHWQPLTGDERFRPQRFSAGLRFTGFSIDGQLQPQGALLVFRRGDPPLFRIALEGPQDQADQARAVELRGLPTGAIEIRSAMP